MENQQTCLSFETWFLERQIYVNSRISYLLVLKLHFMGLCLEFGIRNMKCSVGMIAITMLFTKASEDQFNYLLVSRTWEVSFQRSSRSVELKQLALTSAGWASFTAICRGTRKNLTWLFPEAAGPPTWRQIPLTKRSMYRKISEQRALEIIVSQFIKCQAWILKEVGVKIERTMRNLV